MFELRGVFFEVFICFSGSCSVNFPDEISRTNPLKLLFNGFDSLINPFEELNQPVSVVLCSHVFAGNASGAIIIVVYKLPSLRFQ